MESTTQTNNTTPTPEKKSRAGAWAAGIAIAVLAVTCGFLWREVNRVQAQVVDLNAALEDQVASVRETTAMEAGKATRELATLREDFAAAMKTAESSVGRARTDAKRHAERLAAELAQKQEEQAAEIAQQLSTIEDETSTRFDEVATNVSDVQATVATHRETLDGMADNMRMVRGDMGVMSGRIATNADELQYLRELGERNYFEFDIAKPLAEPVKVGNDVRIELRHTDDGKNRFTMDVFADDKRISKKNRTVNEPIQFYVGGRGGLPYEIVVNKVEKGRIVGYLSTPKVDLLAKR